MVRRVMKILAWTLGLPVGVLLIGFGLLVVFVDAPVKSNVKQLPAFYDTRVDSQYFSYPPSYAILPRHHSFDNTPFVLSLLLPDFAPKTQKNAKYFDTHKYGQRTVRIEVSGISTDIRTILERLRIGALFSRNISQKYPDVVGVPSEHGLVSYGQKYNGNFDVFGEEVDGKLRTLFSCKTYEYAPSPSCAQTFIYDDDIAVRIAYSRRYLSNWKEHELITTALLKSFEKRAALRIRQGVFETRKKTEETE